MGWARGAWLLVGGTMWGLGCGPAGGDVPAAGGPVDGQLPAPTPETRPGGQSTGGPTAAGDGKATPDEPAELPPPLPGGVPSWSLAQLMGVDDPVPVGVAVAPDTGDRYLLDAERGLYRLEDDAAVQIATLTDLVDPLVPPKSQFTDLAACGDGRLLLTARDDGFLFNLADRSMRQFFCYVPETLSRAIPDAGQLTGAVGCDDTYIFAQPQTFDGEGFLVNSQVGMWDLSSGRDLDWYDLDDLDYLAGGLAPLSGTELLLVRDGDYHVFDLRSGAMSLRGELGRFGIVGADGLAIDHHTETAWVLDGRSDQLFAVPLSMLDVR